MTNIGSINPRSPFRIVVLILLLVFSSVSFGQAVTGSLEMGPTVELLQPSGWFDSPETIFAAGTLIAGYIVLLATSLGKDWFRTDGIETIILSAALSVVIAGIGGYYALGFLTGAGGFKGALQAVAMALLSWLGANAKAKYDRQAATAAASRIDKARTQLL